MRGPGTIARNLQGSLERAQSHSALLTSALGTCIKRKGCWSVGRSQAQCVEAKECVQNLSTT
eukprot:scaffold285583_cov10-Tisochrysis_lutea.AAC.1